MNFLITGILSRVDDALFALLAAVIIHLLFIVVCYMLRKNFSPLPIVEWALRPLSLFLSDKLNREGRSAFALIIRGSIVFFILLAFISFAGIIIENSLVFVGLGAYMDTIMLMTLLSPILIIQSSLAISDENPRKGSYRYIVQSLNQNLVIADKYGLNRAACKAMVSALENWVVGPIIFYLLGGMPLVSLYVALNIFIRTNKFSDNAFTSVYGAIFIFFDRLTSIITIIFIFISSIFSAGGRPFKVFKTLRSFSFSTESAMAYAQNITLGGSFQNRHGKNIRVNWLGSDGTTAKLSRQDVLRVSLQYIVTVFLVVAVVFALFVFS